MSDGRVGGGERVRPRVSGSSACGAGWWSTKGELRGVGGGAATTGRRARAGMTRRRDATVSWLCPANAKSKNLTGRHSPPETQTKVVVWEKVRRTVFFFPVADMPRSLPDDLAAVREIEAGASSSPTHLRRAMATMASLSFASVRGALTRRGGFAARTSSAVRPHARGVVSASGAPDVPADAYLVTYCHVRARDNVIHARRALATSRLPDLPPLRANDAELRRGRAGVQRCQGGHPVRARGRGGCAAPHRLLPHHGDGDEKRRGRLERAPAGSVRQEWAPGAGGDCGRAREDGIQERVSARAKSALTRTCDDLKTTPPRRRRGDAAFQIAKPKSRGTGKADDPPPTARETNAELVI